MTRRQSALAVVAIGLAFALAVGPGISSRALAQTDVPPLVVVDTTKGTFTFETFPKEAPITVAHIVALARSGFYNGQRVHRALPGFIVQFGDPQSRDLAKRGLWGRGAAASSGHPVGVAEITTKRVHVNGAVGLAHLGDPAQGDSQMYITLAERPDLDNRYVVFGQVVSGEDVPAKLQVGDVITRVSVKE